MRADRVYIICHQLIICDGQTFNTGIKCAKQSEISPCVLLKEENR